MAESSSRPARLTSRAARFALVFLLIEFLDEFVFGAREAAWPLTPALHRWFVPVQVSGPTWD